MGLGDTPNLQTNVNSGAGMIGMNMFNQGSDRLTQAMGNYAARVKENATNKSIREVLSAERGENELTADFKQGQLRDMLMKKLVSPTDAIVYANAAAAPYEKQDALELAAVTRAEDLGYKDAELVQSADKQASLDEYRGNVTTETTRHNIATENKVTPKGFGAITDDFGTTYIYNKDNGKYEPIVNDSAGKGGVRINSKTPKMALPDGTKVYQDGRGNPIMGTDGKPIVVERSKTNLDIPTTEANFDTLITRLDEGVKTVGQNEGSVGSFGSDPLGFIANNLNDIVQIPTDDFRDRTKIKGYSNALVGTIYKMVETGVMTDADAERYLAQVPKPDDSAIVYRDKANRLREELVANRESIRKRMGIENDYQTDSKAPGAPVPSIINPTVKPPLSSFGF